ncbi:hypothetical protein LOC67_21440 [Stieleria sp. JC731]|uniref:hypothetical protein n=1 Tax=Pirellulaceae TaxID=2691357 RepID=UPI001E65BE83|nr:hypothetical protein [Stieleria sp. JC731]MCC9603122.1 hypothetical protein [Stieleria sp. JC731]
MTNSQRLATVRDHLRRWIQSTYADAVNADQEENSVGEAGIASESILIREGYYVGRTFIIATGEEELRATWFMEPDELKIRDLEGSIVAVFAGEEIYALEAEETQQVTVEADSPAVAADEDDSPVSIPMIAAHNGQQDEEQQDEAEAECSEAAAEASEPDENEGISRAA